MATLVSIRNLTKTYQRGPEKVEVLHGIDLDIQEGDFVALMGPSGSGKTTLLNLIGGLERPNAGRLRVGDLDLLALGPRQLSAYRRERVGFVWQQTTRNLLPYLSARQNIELLMTLAGRRGRERRAWADELLEAVGLRDQAGRRPVELSGGQQQRIALACALANRPQILLGDEPTGEVDWPTAERILALIGELRARLGITAVIVTHDERVADRADRVVEIRAGKVSAERRGSRTEQA